MIMFKLNLKKYYCDYRKNTKIYKFGNNYLLTKLFETILNIECLQFLIKLQKIKSKIK